MLRTNYVALRIVRAKFPVFTWRHGGHICSLNKEMAALIVSPTNPPGIFEFFSHANDFICLD